MPIVVKHIPISAPPRAETLKTPPLLICVRSQTRLLQRHVVNSEYRWQRDVVRVADLNPHCLPRERTEIERPLRIYTPPLPGKYTPRPPRAAASEG